MIKVSDFVINFIADLGVKHIFMLPGGGCMHLVDSLGKNKRLKYICNLHEQASAIAAEAYGQYTNHLGVILVTTGPGGTNTITGLAGAWIDSTPMLIISGQAKKEDMLTGRGIRQMGIQEVDIISVVSPITKYAITVMEPDMIKFHLQKAVYEARNGRKGPVWLDMPLDVQGAMVDEDKLKEFTPLLPSSTAEKKLERTARKILDALAVSKRPVILAGNGIRLSKSISESLKFFEHVGVPILTTWKMTDFIPENHPLYCGRPGIVGQRGANFTQQNSDCLLILGARLDLC
ncbi:MAG: thiamine pyrophosphate-binding protein, partial [Lentisphaerae bacterium]|nr:thiamine pyrophosphate-binding protein [Lentisphaerota bacterium]